MHYRLSNRQRKELYVRRRPILIALPLSRDDYAEAGRDPRGVAARLLPEVDETIESAEITGIEVQVDVSHARPAPGSLSESLGAIKHRDHRLAGGMLECRVEVLLVTLSHGSQRNPQALMQWPHCLVIDGQPLPAAGSATEGAD